MAKLTPDEFAEKQGRRLKGSLEDIRRGVERVTASPTRAAASKVEKMRSGINAALDSGKWQNKLAAVSLEEWKADMLEKGVGRISSGIDRAKGKVASFAGKLLPFQDSLKSEVSRMDDTTVDARIDRAVAWMRGMSKFKP